ncbi:hypothetical protein [Paenibacillus paeoniae]|uniref:Uncharacterized protein n=1 Tax=Paenibacillus paeoniae TaxID=2292705 RepID=A0A371PLF4_9BACL|nr:hypothetical protein [Paenibacillus paeoniae]REK76815.1 hypothetical protein DX130_07225 [Paenibacillus paeoniae]
MGEVFKLECDTCQYENRISVGIGFLYTSLKSIASFVKDPSIKQQLDSFMKDSSTSFHAYDAMYVCPQCKGIQNELFIEMQSESSHFKHSCSCMRCGTIMIDIPMEHNVPVQLNCPDCSEGGLKATFYMDWD